MAKHKRKSLAPLPLRMATEFEQNFSGCYQICDDMMIKARREANIWEKVYIPIAASNAIMQTIYGDPAKGTVLHVLYSWRREKQILVFDKTLFSEVIKTEQAERVPVEALESIPYYAFYIDLEHLGMDLGEIFSGFFVTFEEEDQGRELRITAVTSSGEVIPFYLPLQKDKSIGQSLSDSRGTKILEKILGFCARKSIEKTTKILSKFLCLIVYICCKNADIEENPEQKAYRRPPASRDLIKDVPREIQKWDVGWRIGAKLRDKVYTGPEKGGEEKEACEKVQRGKRPHVRAAHYHHFWIGKRGTPERRLVVKWIPPIAINLAPPQETIATLRKIQQ